jgi:hypothetical protein
MAGGTRPGGLMHRVAEGLARAGLDVRQDGHDGISQIDIACREGHCTLWVSDFGTAEWEYQPARDVDPGLAADLAAILLTGHARASAWRGPGGQHLTFKGIVGLDLRARGLDVELAVYPEEDVLNVYAEIVVTSPADTSSGMQVWVMTPASLGVFSLVIPPLCVKDMSKSRFWVSGSSGPRSWETGPGQHHLPLTSHRSAPGRRDTPKVLTDPSIRRSKSR